MFEAASREPLSAMAQKSLTALDFISIFATRGSIIALYEIYIKTHNVAIAKTESSLVSARNGSSLTAFFSNGGFFFHISTESKNSHELAVQVIDSIPGYKPYFKKAFGTDKVTIKEITDALAAFEKTLTTPNSPFDRYLKGDKAALTPQQIKGFELFKTSGCTICHNGSLLGGSSYQKLGVVKPYQTTNTAQGRIEITKKDQDRMTFKVPQLRNIELTYPYFHDGEAKTLEDAVRIMGEVQLGKTYTPEQLADIVAWMKSLTGDQPKIVLPILPPNGKNTPQFDPWKKD